MKRSLILLLVLTACDDPAAVIQRCQDLINECAIKSGRYEESIHSQVFSCNCIIPPACEIKAEAE